MVRLTTITILAALAFAIVATAAADAPRTGVSSGNSSLSGNSSKPRIKPRTPESFQKEKAEREAAAKKAQQRIEKTGSISGKHHPAVEPSLRTAKAKGKKLLLLFMSPKCKICRKMQSEALDVPLFKQNFLKDYVVHIVDCDKNPEIADHYMFTPLIPHYKIIDGNGKIIKEKTGYDSDTKLADWLNAL